MSYTEVELKKIHNQSMFNKMKIRPKGHLCGCFCCEEIFDSSLIKKWTDNKRTALCPNCEIDSVLFDDISHPITPELLRIMYKRWFGAMTNEKEFDFIPVK